MCHVMGFWDRYHILHDCGVGPVSDLNLMWYRSMLAGTEYISTLWETRPMGTDGGEGRSK